MSFLKRAKFWIVAMPALSLLLGGGTIAWQVRRKANLTRKLHIAEAEIHRIMPSSPGPPKDDDD
jgi:hypothetical protein